MTLADGVRATVEERDGEALLRSFDLRADALAATPGEGDDAAVVIGTPGRMLVRDLRPDEATGGQNFRGNVAFGWKDRLDWSPKATGGVLTLTGEATVAVEPAGRCSRPMFTLAGDTMRLVTADRGKQRELTAASADGAVRFVTKGLSFTAARVDYDPAAKTVSARGVDGSPVIVYNDADVPTGRFATLLYNVEAAQIVRVTDAAGGAEDSRVVCRGAVGGSTRRNRNRELEMGWIVALVVGGIVVVGVLGVGLWAVGSYNGLVRLREGVRAGWSQIEVMLKRRHDLIPNLVETVKGYASHESETLERVMAARNGAVAARGVESQSKAEGAAHGRHAAAFRRRRELPRPEGQQQLRPAPGRAGQHGKWHRRPEAVVQQHGAELQPDADELPDEPAGRAVRVHAAGVLRDDDERGARGAAGEVLSGWFEQKAVDATTRMGR